MRLCNVVAYVAMVYGAVSDVRCGRLVHNYFVFRLVLVHRHLKVLYYRMYTNFSEEFCSDAV